MVVFYLLIRPFNKSRNLEIFLVQWDKFNSNFNGDL